VLLSRVFPFCFLGTSAEVVEKNTYNGGQQLYFNKSGKKTPFSVRFDDNADNDGKTIDFPPEMVMIIQIPLRQLASQHYSTRNYDYWSNDNRSTENFSGRGHDECHGLAIERDDRYPIRITLQFLKATTSGWLTDDVAKSMSQRFRTSKKQGYVFIHNALGQPDSQKVPSWWARFWSTYKALFPGYKEARAKRTLFAAGYLGQYSQQSQAALDVLQKDFNAWKHGN